MPARLIDESGDAPVPPESPEIVMRSACALATPAAIVPTPASATSFTDTVARRVHALQIVDQLREIFDRVDVVMRRRRDQRHAGVEWRVLRDDRIDLVAGQLTAFARLGALRDLDLQLAAFTRYSAVTPKRADATCLIALLRSVPKRARSSPPSPLLLRPPSRFIATASVSCASRLSDPNDIAPVTNRLTIAEAGSTSSSGTGSRSTKSSRPRSVRCLTASSLASALNSR